MAHERLGRNRLDQGFKKKFLDTILFTRILSGLDLKAQLTKYQKVDIDTSESLLSELTNDSKNINGHFAYQLRYNINNRSHDVKVVIKVKAVDIELIDLMCQMARACSKSLEKAHHRVKNESAFKNCHIREIKAMRHSKDIRFTTIIPKIYLTHIEKSSQQFYYAMEYLDVTNDISHLGHGNNSYLHWKNEDIKVVLEDIAKFHSLHLHTHSTLPESLKMMSDTLNNTHPTKNLINFYHEQLIHLGKEMPLLFTAERVTKLGYSISRLYEISCDVKRNTAHTLIHNDFNPRNVCIRTLSDGNRKACVYDWELCTIDIPQSEILFFI